MGPRLSMEQYRSIDLFFFAVIAFFSELVISLAASRWYPDQLYTVSATAAITAIVFVRWRGYGLIHAAIGGLALCIALGAEPKQYLIYCAGNLLSVLTLLFLRIAGEKRVRTNAFWTILYGACTLFLMQTGRAVLALLSGGTVHVAIAFYATDSLSYVFTAVILWIARRLDGILENQSEYLARIHAQTEEEKEEIQ